MKTLAQTSPRSADIGLLILRVWFGTVLALGHGWDKIMNLADFTAKVVKLGMPLPSVLGPLAALSEFAGGLLLALGLFTRPSALFVSVTMFVAALKVHAADPFVKKELALAYGVAALVLLIAGPGRFSADSRWLGKGRS